MGPIRLCWIVMMVALAYLTYGIVALQIALAAHVGLRVAGFLLRALIGAPCGVPILFMACYLMYLTVHLLGWGCFLILFLSFCSVEVS